MPFEVWLAAAAVALAVLIAGCLALVAVLVALTAHGWMSLRDRGRMQARRARGGGGSRPGRRRATIRERVRE